MQVIPHKFQQKVLDSTARYIAAIAGIQSGKTLSGVLWLLQEIVKHPKDDFLIAAPTYKILEQATLKKFFEYFPLTYQGQKIVEYRKQDSVLKIMGGGNIYIRSTEIPNNIEGMTLRAAWLDEAGMMKQQIWTNILGRVAIKKGRVLMTSSPYNVGWLYNEVERQFQAGNKDFEVLRWKSIDNPYFPPEEYERAKKILTEAEFERRYHGEFRKMEGLVYPDWNGEKMIFASEKQDGETQFKEIIAGVDYGFSNPAAIEVVGITQKDEIYVLDELYSSRLTINEIVKEAVKLKTQWNISMFYVDPSAPSLIESLNLNNCPSIGANNDVDFGILRVQQLMKLNKFHISIGNNNLLEEIEVYHFKPVDFSSDKVPEFKKKPDKIYDHAVDAVRYAIATHPIEIYFDGSVPTFTRMNTFWERIKKRTEERKLRIDRYGADYADEDIAALDQTGYFL